MNPSKNNNNIYHFYKISCLYYLLYKKFYPLLFHNILKYYFNILYQNDSR